MHLVAGLLPDTLGSLSAPPNALATIREGVLLLRGRERGREGKGDGSGGEGKKREGKGRGLPPLYLSSGYGPE